MNLNSFASGWIAIHVRPRYEFITSDLLRYKGYEVFTPTFRSHRQWSDRKKALTLPLFEGYVFCHFRAEIATQIMGTPGVICIVGTRTQPARIEEREIEALQRIDSNGLLARPCSFVNAGDRVRILEGSLAGIEGILVRNKGRDSLVLSVELVQRSVDIELHGVKVELLTRNNSCQNKIRLAEESA